MKAPSPTSERKIILTVPLNVPLERLIEALQQNFVIEIEEVNSFKLISRNPVPQSEFHTVEFQDATNSFQASVSLKKKEFEILKLLARGYSYGQISAFLQISLNGVRYYIKKLYKALDVQNAREAANWYHECHKNLQSYPANEFQE
ncbi:helix-turn-helix transcriptional regulator [Arundinibacter roseus]|uniref:Helix-turn-helix transcriptional regulator n=1 Tax=Arundinibacter roseus TaxID=2070510 RepID=A0A4R4JVF2_9BACT|nr:LuxR C-terminal-related transcriptional regulator [Arundinibacter roseus]TDB58688.1 helix-turn-helix transcriptional regulator [Arundinibacter roseus]